jgi:uncharacterized integral membrane protein
MMRRLTKMIDALVYEHSALAWAPSVALVVLLVFSVSLRESLPLQLSADQDTFYSTTASVGATLLGFLIAVVALLAVLPDDRPLIRKIRSQGLLRRTVRQVGRACFAMGIVTGCAILGLVVDRPPEEAVQAGDLLADGAYWIWVVAVTAIPAAVLLALSTATVIRVILLMGGDEK